MPKYTKAGTSPTEGLGAKSVPAVYKFGTPEDLANRNDTSYRKSPRTRPSHFTQIQPSSGSGESLNRPSTPVKSGNLKFTRDPS